MYKRILIPMMTVMTAAIIFCNTRGIADERSNATQAQVPIFLSGIILKAPQAGICMQGNVKYSIIHYDLNARQTVTNRLAASSGKADAYLTKVAGTRTRVAVAGYIADGVEGPQCAYVNAYYAGPEQDLIGKLQKD